MPEEITDKYREPIQGDPKAMEEDLPIPEKKSEQEKVLMQDQDPNSKDIKEEKVKEESAEVIKEAPKEKVPDQKLQQAEETKTQKINNSDDQKKSGNIKSEAHRITQLNQQDQAKALCELAFQQGIDFAVDVAKEINSPYLLDEFHDSLVDDFKEKLKEQL